MRHTVTVIVAGHGIKTVDHEGDRDEITQYYRGYAAALHDLGHAARIEIVANGYQIHSFDVGDPAAMAM